jgi:hypothetical protein
VGVLTGDVGGPVEGLGHVGVHLDEVVLLGLLIPLVAPGLHPAGEGLPDLRVEDVDEELQNIEVSSRSHRSDFEIVDGLLLEISGLQLPG